MLPENKRLLTDQESKKKMQKRPAEELLRLNEKRGKDKLRKNMRQNLETKQVGRKISHTNEKQLKKRGKTRKNRGNLEMKQVGRRTAAKAVMKCLLHLVIVCQLSDWWW